jgi:predicted tellurium resistance membrane protein TerC
LGVAIASTVVVLLTFAFTTLVEEPATAVALAVILLLSIALDIGWKRARDSRVPLDGAEVESPQVGDLPSA